MESIGTYVTDEKDGLWGFFYPNDQLKQEQQWSMGNLIETSDFYSIKGESLFKGTLSNENGTYFEYYPEGEIKLEATLKNGLFNDKYKGYHINKAIAFQGQMNAGLRQGVWSFYHYNGALESSGTYLNSEKIGTWRYYSKLGRLLNVSSY